MLSRSMKKHSFRNCALGVAASMLMVLHAGSAFAIPALQLGPGAGDWTYDAGSQTWVSSDNPIDLNAYANSDGAGANGAYAWDAAGGTTQTAYLIIAATPSSTADPFDITIGNDGGTLSLYDSGFGTPPIEDPNSIAGHGIFDTYFEIYQFEFDGAVTSISDIQPGGAGTGEGFEETFTITVNSILDGTNLHFDLFTVQGDGALGLGSSDRRTVNAFAPFSHDAGSSSESPVPEPSAGLLFTAGSLIIGGVIRRRR
jgi:hypothetical protein